MLGKKHHFIYLFTKGFRNLVFLGSFSGTMHKFLISILSKESDYSLHPEDYLFCLYYPKDVCWVGFPRVGMNLTNHKWPFLDPVTVLENSQLLFTKFQVIFSSWRFYVTAEQQLLKARWWRSFYWSMWTRKNKNQNQM